MAKKTSAGASGKRSSYTLSQKERTALKKGAEADMKKHGFKTPEELAAHYDKKRGY